MELTRRDAVAALAAVGIGGVAAYSLDESTGGDGSPGGGSSEHLLETAVALSAVVYPAEVTGREEFVRTFVSGRVEDDPEYGEAMAEAAATLDERAREEYDASFRTLAPGEGDDLLGGMAMDRVGPDPDGSERQRVRFYLVNELLYALLTSPKGGRLAGIENPPGYPGGLASYQEGPRA